MTERELEIVEILKHDPLISQDELADKLSITRSGAATHIHNLMKKGYIKGRGYILNESKFVTVVGGNNIDILGIPTEKLIRFNSNPGKIYYTFGGAGRNIACALSHLGVSNYFISVYGDDLNGEKFLKNCKENNIDIRCCEKIPGEHTSSFIYLDNSKGIKYIGINDMEIYDKITPEFLANYLDRLNTSQYCVVDTNIPEQSFQYIYRNVNVPIIVKTTSIHKNARLIQENQVIYLLVTTSIELKELISAYGEEFSDIDAAMEFLLTKNIMNIAVFSISDGLYLKNKSHHIHLQKPIDTIANTAGSCATLTSAIIWGLQNEMSWNRIMRYGYSAILLSLQSRNPIHPLFSQATLVEQERQLFENK